MLLILLGPAAVWLVRPVQAQVLYGSVLGTVVDPSGASVLQAPVVLTNKDTGQTRETSTDAGGRYSIVNLLPGRYELKVTASGFKPVVRPDIDVTINTVTRIDLTLEVGAVTEQVTVSGEATVLQTDKSDVRSEITSRAIANLPLANYRNFQSLVNLVPGATPANFQNAVVDTPARALTTNINGTARNNNNARVDGATNVFIWLPHHMVYGPPVESIDTVNPPAHSTPSRACPAGRR